MRQTMRFFIVLGLGAAVWLVSAAQVTAQSPNPQSGGIGLTGTLPADPPQNAPTISVPSNGQSFSVNPITVSGVCQTDLLIKVFKNGIFAGSAQCESGTYSLSIDLLSGRNDLIARAFDDLDQSSPDSATVTVTFVDANPPSSLVNKLNLTTNFARRGANPGEVLTWPFIVSGGRSPYAISVEWGDGATGLVSRPSGGEFELTHTYDSPGLYRVVVKASDALGETAYFQVVAQANGAIVASEDAGQPTRTITKVVWIPAVIAIPLIGVAFWLGRRHQMRTFERLLQSGQSPLKR